MNLNLTGMCALVGGGSRGIGRATAAVLAELGAEVTVAARESDAIDDTVQTLPTTQGQQHSGLAVDFTDNHELADRVQEWAATKPSVAIVINNSGGPPAGPAFGADVEAFATAFKQHLLAYQTIAGIVEPGMREVGYGRIINVISTSVKEPIKGLGVSNTIRGAVASWAKTLATELGPYGITVNNVLPGFTATERLSYLFGMQAKRAGKTMEDIEGEARQRIPLGRFAAPDEIANVIAFLASPAAGYVNGINVPVDGGRTMSL